MSDSEEIKKLALRITMGSGKTTVAIRKLKETLKDNPNLNIEIYVPRHDLADEIRGLLDGCAETIEVIAVRGRDYDHENNNAPCRRYEYVKSLVEAGLSVRTNACIRNDGQRCDYLSECAYWRQFSKSNSSTGSIRIFPHSYLDKKRNDQLPEPDITIIDESFFQAGHISRSIPDGRLRTLLNTYLGNTLGDVIASALRDKVPLLQLLREQGLSSKSFDPSILNEAESQISFESSRTNAPLSNQQSNTDIRTAKTILKVISEELDLEDRQEISRLRYWLDKSEIHVDYFSLNHIAEGSHILILDATADNVILEKVLDDIEFERIDIHQQAYVTQIYDRTGSKISWKNEDKINELISMLKEHSSIGEQVLCISHQVLEDQLREQGFPENLQFAHFNKLRGIDTYRDFDTVFITGRNQPKQSDVDGTARAIFWNDDRPLKHDPAAELDAPTETNLPTEVRGYFLVSPDEQYGVSVRSFTDGRIEAIHQQIREAETVQAIARLRLVHAEQIKNVYLLGNLPIEIPINRPLWFLPAP